MTLHCCWLTAALAKKYYQVLQRYYVQYMSGYDADVLNQLIQVRALIYLLNRQKLHVVCEFVIIHASYQLIGCLNLVSDLV